jgi:hypothetical protein
VVGVAAAPARGRLGMALHAFYRVAVEGGWGEDGWRAESHAEKSPHGFTPAARRPAGYPDPAQRRALDIVLSAIRELALWAEASYACHLGKGLRPRLVEGPLVHRLTARVATPLNWRFGRLLLPRLAADKDRRI